MIVIQITGYEPSLTAEPLPRVERLRRRRDAPRDSSATSPTSSPCAIVASTRSRTSRSTFVAHHRCPTSSLHLPRRLHRVPPSTRSSASPSSAFIKRLAARLAVGPQLQPLPPSREANRLTSLLARLLTRSLTRLLARLLACSLACLLACSLACLLALPACSPACLVACSLACLLACLPIWTVLIPSRVPASAASLRYFGGLLGWVSPSVPALVPVDVDENGLGQRRGKSDPTSTRRPSCPPRKTVGPQHGYLRQHSCSASTTVAHSALC